MRERIDDFWFSTLADYGSSEFPDADLQWQEVSIPHNWETYEGYQVRSHGNLHGTAWYRREILTPRDLRNDEHLFIEFEGVSSYATVWLNGTMLGSHEGGRTSFSLELTHALNSQAGAENILMVKVEHPEAINDLPFVCGGCWGAPNTEGSQPFGVFRPVHLYRTGPVRTLPYGVFIRASSWSGDSTHAIIRTELRNYSSHAHAIIVRHRLFNSMGRLTWEISDEISLDKSTEMRYESKSPIFLPLLWSTSKPYLYELETTVEDVAGRIFETSKTSCGFRRVQWPRIAEPNADHNVRSIREDRKLLDLGDAPPSESNNGYTHVLFSHCSSPLAHVAPMGVRIFTDKVVNNALTLRFEIEVEAAKPLRDLKIAGEMQNDGGTVFFLQFEEKVSFEKAGKRGIALSTQPIHHPVYWEGVSNPYLHKLVIDLSDDSGELLQRTETTFGIRDSNKILNLGRPVFGLIPEAEHSRHPVLQIPREERVFRINGEPCFQNGTGGYENLLGCDHAFTDAQVYAQAAHVRAAGFNAFRDAHHPHNLRYYDYWDKWGILCWTQMGSHIYFDNECFRRNYLKLTREWVRERRNHPSIIIYGIQNESTLPEAFAKELREAIIDEDPTVPSERITTTCNGGKGSDWNVPQEWSGTYGGNCQDYDPEKLQLVGEYGAWRTFGKHVDVDYKGDENDRSEGWAAHNLGVKIAIAERCKTGFVGHYQWALNSFANPGRTAENFECLENGAVGPVNYKGLFTCWHQPSDIFYLYRSAYVPASREPMVYIVSHTWPNRWSSAGTKNCILVYSNCDSVELFNDFDGSSLGICHNPGPGKPFRWDGVFIETNVLHAKGRIGAKIVAQDILVLSNLPPAAGWSQWRLAQWDSLQGTRGLACFRINCGSNEDYIDCHGQVWLADRNSEGAQWKSTNWSQSFDHLPEDLASRSFSMAPVYGTKDSQLYQTQRYGREKLTYQFTLEPGRYKIALHFVESWYGLCGYDASGWRVFDVAINKTIILKDYDVYVRARGANRAVVETAITETKSGHLEISFPRIMVAQALIAAIEIIPIVE